MAWISVVQAQHTFQAIIRDAHSGEALVGATAVLKGTDNGATANNDGFLMITDIPVGKHGIVFSFVGYESQEKMYDFPMPAGQPVVIRLEDGEELEEVVVSATRGSRTIEEVPTRIEAITAEELGEKAVMNSANIAMLLRESTGILMQQTSANSANQSIRIQGLDGRYTQILKDGFPLFGGFSSGLSIMQIPPLDLRQVEVIKGSASTLYGGGAIAGLVNLVTKTPDQEAPVLDIMLNQTSASGTTANAFYAQKYGKTGLSIYASANRQQSYDANKDDFSDIPKVRGLTLNPKFFWYPDEETTLWFGINTAIDDRLGGDMQVIDGLADATHVFTEHNLSNRISSQLAFDKKTAASAQWRFRNSINYFNREISVPGYLFEGHQVASFTEASYLKDKEKSQWVFGANLFTDDFKEQQFTGLVKRDYNNTTLGAFGQGTGDINEWLVAEGGLRTDYNTQYGTFVLPRLSLLFRTGGKLTGRLGGAMGYKLPTIFTEEAEAFTFRGILPVDMATTRAEQSIGSNFDLNYETLLGDKMTFSVNQLFYYTRISDALVLRDEISTGSYWLENAIGTVDSRGFESNVKLTYGDIKLFFQYAFIDVLLNYDNINNQKPLTPRHNAGAVLMYEQHGNWRVGLEAYYTGQQYRTNYSTTRDYWVVGFMAMRELDRFSFFLNFENFIDTRQSRFEAMVHPPFTNPAFSEIWAPTDGFVANGGLIWKVFGGHE